MAKRHARKPLDSQIVAAALQEADEAGWQALRLNRVAARLGEVAEILATGLQRARARKSSALLSGERVFLVEPLARQSGAVAEIEGDTQ